MYPRTLVIRLLTFCFVFLLAIPWLPAAAQDAPAVPLPQAEIAYVLDGDLWLYDTISGDSTQLTQDGDNQWPSWSRDGSTLLYTHVKGEEKYDLYALDMATLAPRVVAEDACCGGYALFSSEEVADSNRLLYVDLSGGDLILRSIWSDGLNAMLLDLREVESVRGLWPAGSILWGGEQGSEDVLIPADIVVSTAESGMFMFRTAFSARFDDSKFKLELYLGNPALSDCQSLVAGWLMSNHSILALHRVDLNVTPGGFVDRLECPDDLPDAPRSVSLRDSDGVLLNLDGPSGPATGADDAYWFAAERYLPGETLEEQALEGIVVVTASESDGVSQTLIIPGGSQPAWRPAPPIPPALASLAQQGERVVALDQALMHEGHTYTLSYFTTGTFVDSGPTLLLQAGPEFFAKQKITGLALTTEDGHVVLDPVTIRQILVLFRAAAYLYDAPPPDQSAEFEGDLDAILIDPILRAMTPGTLLRDETSRTQEALRAILTDQVSDQTPVDTALANLSTPLPSDFAGVLDVLQGIVDNTNAQNEALGLLTGDLAKVASGLDSTLLKGTVGLQIMEFTAKLLYLSHLQEERAVWLAEFIGEPLNGADTLSRKQMMAAITVLGEVNDLADQRMQVATDFTEQVAGDAVSAGAISISADTASKIVATMAKSYNSSTLHFVAGALASVSLALTINSILFGADDLVGSFQLAKASENLRAVFASGRYALQELAAGRDPDDVYSGPLADKFRKVYLLETLAAVQARRDYADGLAATYRLPNWNAVVSWFTGAGKDFPLVVAELRSEADSIEAEAIMRFDPPDFLDATVAMATERVAFLPKPELATDGEMVLIPAGPFQMGCDSTKDLCELDELPLHQISLDTYAIDKYEVTNARYAACVAAGVCTPPEFVRSTSHALYYGNPAFAEFPVVYVGWDQATAFCKWEGKRLPTEAEWEKAARGTDGRIFPWGNESDQNLANFGEGVGDTTAVGSYPGGASPYGVMDMAGNVWEWTEDWYGSDYYGISEISNPAGPAFGDYRVLRGGSFLGMHLGVRSSFRFTSDRGGLGGENIGFRCVRSSMEPSALPPSAGGSLQPTNSGGEMNDDEEVLIPAGEFQMGCDAANPEDVCNSDEEPLHTVTLGAYTIDKYEVTNDRYENCVDAGSCTPPHAMGSSTRPVYGDPEFVHYPVINVDWTQAAQFCAWEGKRLPTEAEWEKAARGTDGRVYPWGSIAPDTSLLNYAESRGDTTAVGSYPLGASPYGVMDMAGNVWEWTADWYDGEYYGVSSPGNPTGPEAGEDRVLRGGSWGDDGEYARAAFRGNRNPDTWHNEYVGFRCVRSGTVDSAAAAPLSPTSHSQVDMSDEILIPAGEFQMGCSPDDDQCDDDEKPLHTVTLDAYAIDKYEVTNARYGACVAAGACTPPHEVSSYTHDPYYGNPEFADYPVIKVDWGQADAFCRWESKRLPTEAEWEKAARGSDDTRIYPWGNDAPTDKLLNFSGNVGDTSKVGSYPNGASPYGVMDMSGNVWEWVNDWFEEAYYAASPGDNPQGPPESGVRVFRGGSWSWDPGVVRASRRSGDFPGSWYIVFGFRCVRSQ